nr:uncharacterized protein LOC129265291 [Lytechinus pictus]
MAHAAQAFTGACYPRGSAREETWVGSPPLEAEQALSEDEFNPDPPGSPAPQPAGSRAQDATEILHKYLPHIYPPDEPVEGDLDSLFFPQPRKTPQGQRIHPARPFQNGNTSIHSAVSAGIGLGRLPRSQGRLLPYSNSSRITGPIGFSLQRSDLQVPGNALRLTPGTLFTRVVTAVAAHLRERGLRLFVYLDDWLLVASSKARLLSHLSLLLRITQELGFVVNWEKSDLSPSRVPTYLGAVLDLPNQIARPSPDRVRAIVALARSLRERSFVKARTWLRLLGFMASLVDILQDCRLLMRPFQKYLLYYYRPSVDSLLLRIPLSREIRLSLAAWTHTSFVARGKPFRTPLPSAALTTDASLTGWGGHCAGEMVSGVWLPQRTLPHINVLEMRAVINSLQHFRHRLVDRTVLIRTDNKSVAAYINRQGGTRSSSLNALAAELWEWCHRAKIVPVASYIPGSDNLIADFLSRGRCLPSEWSLHPEIFQSIQVHWGPLEIDLFATALNRKLPMFCSRVNETEATSLDAFSIHWGDRRCYAFPPFHLIPQVLRKVKEDQAWLLLVAPNWPRRHWFPQLLELLEGDPLTLPLRSDIVSQPLSGITHPRPAVLHLTAWLLSGKTRKL